MLEKEMFPSLKSHLESLGFEVKAEVLNTDITAVKDDLVVIIEMKKTLNTRLMYQGTKRQRICDYVYLAIEKPNYKVLASRPFREKMHLVVKLQLGLIFVDMTKQSVETMIDPKNYKPNKNKILKRRLLKEFEQRYTSFNTGGVTKTKIITAYREKALMIAYHLQNGPKKVKEIKEITGDYKCSSILQKNYYGWFDRIERGTYMLNDIGIKDLSNYDFVVEKLLQR